MDEEEQEKLSEIHSEVKGSHAQIRVINERTRNIEDKLEAVNEDVESNDEDINELQSKVKRNTTILSAFTGGLSMVLLWISDKITRIL